MSNAANNIQETRKGVKPAKRDIIYYEDPFYEAKLLFSVGRRLSNPPIAVIAGRMPRVTGTWEQVRKCRSPDKQKATARKVVSERRAKVVVV